MQRIPVESSDIVAIGYDEPSRTLEIEFHNDRIYQYRDVEPNVHAQLMRADSYGQFFSTFITRRYRYQKVEKGEARADSTGPIAFVTSNTIKFRHMQEACNAFDIEVERLDLPVDEIQSDDAEEIAVKKSKQAFKLAGRPIVVNDSYWNILALRGFPGAYMNHVEKWLRPEDFLKLMEGKSDRDVILTDTVVYYDGKRTKIFTTEHHGTIIHEPRGEDASIGKVVILDGQTQTIAEVWQTGGFNIALENSSFYHFAKWFNMHRRIKGKGAVTV